MVLEHPVTGKKALYGLNSGTCAVLPLGEPFPAEKLESAAEARHHRPLEQRTADRSAEPWHAESSVDQTANREGGHTPPDASLPAYERLQLSESEHSCPQAGARADDGHDTEFETRAQPSAPTECQHPRRSVEAASDIEANAVSLQDRLHVQASHEGSSSTTEEKERPCLSVPEPSK